MTTTQQNDKFYRELSAILAKYHAHHHTDENELGGQQNEVDPATKKFGRYLRALRRNAGLSEYELAVKLKPAEIELYALEAEIYALEHGLIPANAIAPKTLHGLAEVLNEDIQDFALLLKRDIPKPGVATVLAHCRNGCKAAIAYLGSTKKFLVLLAVMVAAMLISLATVCAYLVVYVGVLADQSKEQNAIVFVGGSGGSWPPQTQGISYASFTEPFASFALNANRWLLSSRSNISSYWQSPQDWAISNLGMQPAQISSFSIAILLLLIIIWLAIWRGEIPLTLAPHRQKLQKGLAFAAPLVALYLVLLVGFQPGWWSLRALHRGSQGPDTLIYPLPSRLVNYPDVTISNNKGQIISPSRVRRAEEICTDHGQDSLTSQVITHCFGGTIEELSTKAINVGSPSALFGEEALISRWNFDGSGLALIADFQGNKDGNTDFIRWQGYWYTDIVTPGSYVYSLDVPNDNSPASLLATISTAKEPLNALTKFTIGDPTEAIFTNTISANYMITGTYTAAGPSFFTPRDGKAYPFTINISDEKIDSTKSMEGSRWDNQTEANIYMWDRGNRKAYLSDHILQWHLEANQLSATIPPMLGDLTNLASLSLHDSQPDIVQPIARGDFDGDGDLDLATGKGSLFSNVSENQVVQLYRNDNGLFQLNWESSERDSIRDIAWGDFDNDGDLDLAAANEGQNRLYRNDNGKLTSKAIWSVNERESTHSIAWGDYDGDGDLDLAVGNAFIKRSLETDVPQFISQPNQIYRNEGVIRDGTLDFELAWQSIDEDQITTKLTWLDFDQDGDIDLIADNQRLSALISAQGQNRVYQNEHGKLTDLATILSGSFTWRPIYTLETGPDLSWGDYDADGELTVTINDKGERSLGDISAAFSQKPLYTNHFYTDPVIAGQSISYTIRISDHIPLFLTTQTTYTEALARQQFALEYKPFFRFNLTVSLGWEVGKDHAYLEQLKTNLQRTSTLLYDWSNGQATLGNITIYDKAVHWQDADVRIYASNQIRPSASGGGIPASAKLTPSIALAGYSNSEAISLQKLNHMVRLWDDRSNLSKTNHQDWPQTLAHELGHYLLSLNDSYFGHTDLPYAAAPIRWSSIMSDPMNDSEFTTQYEWLTSGDKRPKMSLQTSDTDLQSFLDHAQLGPNYAYYLTIAGHGLQWFDVKDNSFWLDVGKGQANYSSPTVSGTDSVTTLDALRKPVEKYNNLNFTGNKETLWREILFAISRSLLIMILFSIISIVVIREGKSKLMR